MRNWPKVLLRGVYALSTNVRSASIGISQNSRIMKSPATTTDRTAVTVVEISDSADANAGIEPFDLDAVQLQSLPFRARRVVVRAGAATVVFTSTN